VLIATVRRIQRALRESDTLARFGGDEFAAVLPSVTDVVGVAAVAQRISGSFKPAIHQAELALQVDVSAGFALFPQHARDAESLVKRADAALYDKTQLQWLRPIQRHRAGGASRPSAPAHG
jgi:diguanylate cyclase (GGDEF)-like protein